MPDEILSAFPFGRRWPELLSGPVLSVRDVALLDLARHCAMRAAFPLGTIKADTDELWNALRDRADALPVDLDRDAVLDALEVGAHAWAEERAAAHAAAMEN